MDPDYVGIYSGGNVDDPSIVSSVGGTIGSNTQKSKFSAMGSVLTPGMNAGAQSIYTEDEQSFEDHLRNRRQNVQREEYFDIFAPGGKLGVVIDTPNSGAPIVHNIKDTCPIADQLRVGDKLICVDDEDVRSMTAVKVSKLISQKSNNPTRKFTISRVIEDS
jgi:PDZ domain-containing secreted protein